MPKREVLQDWVLVENFQVDASQRCSYEYHVVQDSEARRITLTIKCLDEHANTVRLDPTVISEAAASAGYAEIAERRIRHLFRKGMLGG
ncbi:MAG: hypothetical protein R3E82_19195 [Pseudomonadales bacterium]|nr:hypothetical protein [Pseudomonadales bacterium]